MIESDIKDTIVEKISTEDIKKIESDVNNYINC